MGLFRFIFDNLTYNDVFGADAVRLRTILCCVRALRGCSKFPPARPQEAGRLRRTLAVRRREARD